MTDVMFNKTDNDDLGRIERNQGILFIENKLHSNALKNDS